MLGESSSLRWDRRRYPRAPFLQTVDLRSAEWPPCVAVGRDVSVGGIGLALSRVLAAGERVTVGLPLPSDLRIAFTAEVRNVRAGEREGEFVTGMRWVDTSDEDAEVLRVLLEDLGSIGLG
jgi:hypothetical protein